MPEVAPEILVATAGPVTAKRAGRNADGLITVGAPLEKIDGLFAKFAEGAREAGKDPDTMPKVLQLHMSWAETDEQALANAIDQWPNGGMKFPGADIRSPHDFAQMAKLVRPEDFDGPAAHLRRPRRAPRRSSGTSTSASTGSTCTTSGATSPSGSRSSAATCCPSCTGERRRGPPTAAARGLGPGRHR